MKKLLTLAFFASILCLTTSCFGPWDCYDRPVYYEYIDYGHAPRHHHGGGHHRHHHGPSADMEEMAEDTINTSTTTE